MCMFNSRPKKAVIKKAITAWKIFAPTSSGGLTPPIYSAVIIRGKWLTSTKPGFHAFLTRGGALDYKRQLSAFDNVVCKIKVRGTVYGEGANGQFKGIRVSEMFVPKKAK